MALYSGVAVIALYNSEYYKKKFKGLAEIINNPIPPPAGKQPLGHPYRAAC